MPIGSVSTVAPVIECIYRTATANNLSTISVLDVGCGTGFYGMAIRQWMEVCAMRQMVYILGVEGWSANRTPLWTYHYNHVHEMLIQDYLKIAEKLNDKFDFILLLDVLEHFSRIEGAFLLERLKSHLHPGGKLIVGTPSIFIPQGAFGGNELEIHQSVWNFAMLRRHGFEPLFD